MKVHNYLIILILTLSCGCSAKKEIQELQNTLNQGGQPGAISTGGQGLIESKGAIIVLDERVSVKKLGGLGKDRVTRAKLSDSNDDTFEIENNIPDNFSTIVKTSTYINVGCGAIPPEKVEGLTEESGVTISDSVYQLAAEKVFICGENKLPQGFVFIYADVLVINDMTLEVAANSGAVKVFASAVELNGENKIESNGLSKIITGPSIHFYVSNIITGDGSLDLISVGGDYDNTNAKSN